MSELRFAPQPEAAVRRAQAVAFLAPERLFKGGWIERAVKAPWTGVLGRAAGATAAGPAGKLVRLENPGSGPARLLLGVLPDAVSRHNSPARGKALTALLKQGELKEGRVALVLGVEEEAHGLALATAVAQAFPLFDRSTAARAPLRVEVAAARSTGAPLRIGRLEQEVVRRVRWAAQLVDTPPQDLNTTHFVAAARAAARGIPGLTVSVIRGRELLARRLGGIHAVGRAAAHPPQLLLLRYRPARPRRTVALVGKGVVYDTGGLSLKPTASMAGMKFDMAGAAAVVGATLALATLKHRDAIVCAAPLVENAIGPGAYRPDDILTLHSGKTVEINNTDAEGRLLLADALSFVARTHKPALLVDLATLTGAQLVATGLQHAAVVSNRAGVEAAAVRAGRDSGDLTHPLPFAPELYQPEFRSEVADMRNSVADRANAQSSCAAQFVYSHVADLDLPWLHVDMAGPAGKARATGYGVALLARLLNDLEASDLQA